MCKINNKINNNVYIMQIDRKNTKEYTNFINKNIAWNETECFLLGNEKEGGQNV